MSYSIYSSATPTFTPQAGADVIGIQFSSLLAGSVLGIRFYKGATNLGTHIGTLWSATGSNLAQVTFTGETSSGWQYMAFTSPYAILGHTNYVASVLFPIAIDYTGGLPGLAGSPFGNPIATGSSLYTAGGSNVFPTTVDSSNQYFVDIVLDNVVRPSGVRNEAMLGHQCVVGALKGISLGDLSSIYSDNTFERHMQTGVREELVDGYPSPPCLALDYPGFWRFRWQLAPGTQTISVWAKQVSNVTGKRPQMIVKANPAIGLAADVVGTAASSTGWTKIGPIGVTASAAGVVWVELWNKDTDTFYSTSYFDTIGN